MTFVPVASANLSFELQHQPVEPARYGSKLTPSYNHSDVALAGHVPDLLLGLFLAGLLTAAASFVGMARAASRGAHTGAPGMVGPVGGDVLEDYREACAHRGRSPLLLYAYLSSLFIGLGALLVALL